ncbi:MAG: hypothetical protein AAF311_06510 [Pseudomonadota bacterium]
MAVLLLTFIALGAFGFDAVFGSPIANSFGLALLLIQIVWDGFPTGSRHWLLYGTIVLALGRFVQPDLLRDSALMCLGLHVLIVGTDHASY